MSRAHEVNLDGLVGPTHNYAGLSYGNLASMEHGGRESNPRAAALQGLSKMKLLMDLGVKQAVLPPQERPDVEMLRKLGFEGGDGEVLARAGRDAPLLLSGCSSASSMWAANAATVSPSADASDGRPHFTPANLVTQFHRSLEPSATGVALRAIFPAQRGFVHHPALPASPWFGDEGAANHMRLCARPGDPGVQVFVHGRRSFDPSESAPTRFPARQAREASEAVARMHRLEPRRTLFLRQNPEVVDEGVFHNDVIAVCNENVLFCHERAFADGAAAIDGLRETCRAAGAGDLLVIAIPEARLSVREAVSTYLFNSQIVTLPDGGMALIAPAECRESPRVKEVLEEVLAAENPIRVAHFADVRQSMRNGGGPACLRLRVVLTEEELAAATATVFLNETLHGELNAWVGRHYRDRLRPEDLADPALLDEVRRGLDELTRILGIGSAYRFQEI